jgi:3-deoxy-7-phosphoheptulonate synthase
MVLVDFHPFPPSALVDGPQALRLEELPHFVQDVGIVREAYERRVIAAERAEEFAIAAEAWTPPAWTNL